MARRIDSHVVNPVNDRIRIDVLDDRGAGNANHEYLVAWDEIDGRTGATTVVFQNGPIADNGVNGLTQEVLLAIVADRLEGFQAGEYASRENAIALTKVQEAMMWLQRRTIARMKRGVEGTLTV